MAARASYEKQPCFFTAYLLLAQRGNKIRGALKHRKCKTVNEGRGK